LSYARGGARPTATLAGSDTVNTVVVLLVDEGAGVRARLRERIARPGTEVHEANDGIEAQAIAVSTKLDVIVLDVHVRAETGLGMLARLRESARCAVIIVLTNEATDVHRRECLRHGADHFFDKSREFDAAVELVLARAAKPASRA
jgi:DNA-binding response OmpR family regulator